MRLGWPSCLDHLPNLLLVDQSLLTYVHLGKTARMGSLILATVPTWVSGATVAQSVRNG